MNGERIDLHMHSYYSDDGEFTPAQLVKKCKDAGIQVMAVADHNCARANAEVRMEANKAGIRYISAIEIDCTYKGVNLHVLGYGIDDEHPDFADIENNIKKQNVKASMEMLEKTRMMGFDVSEQEMKQLAAHNFDPDVWTGEMFGEVLLAKSEYQNHPLFQSYREGGERSDNPYVNFYWDFYSQGKPCYAEVIFPDLQEVVNIIHKHHGYAVLAHPGMNLKGHRELLDDMLATGLDGIEAFSNYHDEKVCHEFYDQAMKHHLFVTCGSDFHGKTKPSIALGKHGCFLDDAAMLEQIQPLFVR